MNTSRLTEHQLEEFRGTNPSVRHAGCVGIADRLMLDGEKLVIDFKWYINADHRLMNTHQMEFDNPLVVSDGDILIIKSGGVELFITNLIGDKYQALQEVRKLEKASHH
jgi:hypothetical protein